MDMFRAPSDLERSMLSPVPSSPTAMPLTMPLEFEPSVSEHQPTSNPNKTTDSVPEVSSQSPTDTLKPASLSKKPPTHAKSVVMTSGAFATLPPSTDTPSGGLGRFLGYLNPFSSIGSAVDLTDETGNKPSSSEPPAPTVSTIVDTHIATLTRLSPRVSSIPNLQEEEMARIQEWTYAHFTAKMKGTEHTRILKAFVRDIQGLPNLSLGYCSEIHRFADRLLQTLMADTKWTGASHDELLNASEGIEKFIFSKVHDRLFSQLSPGFRKYMGKIDKLVFSLQWVQPDHLDIPTPYWNDKVFAMAAEELKKMSVYKAPKDKVTCLLNCCQVIMNWMKVVHVQDHERRERERKEREEREERERREREREDEKMESGEANVEGQKTGEEGGEKARAGLEGEGKEKKEGEEEEEDQFYDLDGDEERSTQAHAHASNPDDATSAEDPSTSTSTTTTTTGAGAGAGVGDGEKRAKEEKQAPNTTTTTTATAPAPAAKRSRSIGIGNGADNFLPIFVLVLFRAQPEHLAFHVECIAQGRHPERLKGLQDYYFTHLKSVLAFVEQVDARMLSVDRDVYEREMARWGQEWEARHGEEKERESEGAEREEEKREGEGESQQDVPAVGPPDGQVAGRQDVPVEGSVEDKDGNVTTTTNNTTNTTNTATTVADTGLCDGRADTAIATRTDTATTTSTTTTTTTTVAPAPHSRALALALPPSSPFPSLSPDLPTHTTASNATPTAVPVHASAAPSTSTPAPALAATTPIDTAASSSTAISTATATTASPSLPTLSPSLLLALSSLLHAHPSTHPLSLDTITLAQLPALLQELEVLREAVVLVQSAVCADEELALAVKSASGSASGK